MLRTFSSQEMKRFRDFLQSPYFNKNKTIVRLLKTLEKEYPAFELKNISKEKIYQKLFGGKKYNEQVLKNLTSELYKMLKEFLITEFSRSDNSERRLNLLKQMILRKADSVFYSELKAFESELREAQEISESSFYYLYQLEETKISFHLERNEQTLVFEKVLKSGEYLILFFLLNLTKTLSNLSVNKETFNVSYNVNVPEAFFNIAELEEIISYMKDNNVEFSDVAELYFYRIACNRYPEREEYYFKFRNLLLENLDTLNRKEIYGLFNATHIYCLKKINSGNDRFLSELFDIFNIEIDKGFYKYSNSSPVTYMKFRNTYLTGLALKQFHWTEKFISEFGKEIIPSDRDNVVRVANAQVEFEKGNFEKTIEKISTVKTDHIFLKSDIRNLTLMSYYELGYIESALSLIDSFKHFLNNNKKLTDVFRASHLRFLNSLFSLIRFREKHQDLRLEQLRKKLEPFSYERRIKWLIDKIDDVKNTDRTRIRKRQF